MLKIAVAIPVYNEKRNILSLIEMIKNESKKNDWITEIVIVDDNSPDGSGKAIKEKYGQKDAVHLISRPGKLGLGSAYKDAFVWILDNLDMDLIFQMDADLSHPPSMMRKMVTKIEEGADTVIASRYVNGGGIENWPFHRRTISKGANFLFRLILGTKINDVTSGYRVFRSNILRNLMNQELGSKGYEFQIEVLYQLSKITDKIAEVPFVFKNRTDGESKLDVNEIIQFALKLLSLRFRGSKSIRAERQQIER